MTRARALRSGMLLAALVAGCQSPSYLLVEVKGSLSGVYQLQVSVHAPSFARIVMVPGSPRPLSLPETFSLELPGSARGPVDLTVTALGPEGQPLDSATVGLTVGERTTRVEVAIAGPGRAQPPPAPAGPVAGVDAGAGGVDAGGVPDGPGFDAALRPLGTSCTQASECQLGICVDGVCCDSPCTGLCNSCRVEQRRGVCTPVPAGSDPEDECPEDGASTCGRNGACNGAGACGRYPAGTICRTSGCENNSQSFRPASLCDGAGSCLDAMTISCAPSTCAAGTCISSCSSDSHCLAPAVCRGGSCGKRGSAQDCLSNDQCASGYCSQGVCCQSACTGPCQTCARPDRRGVCAPLPSPFWPDAGCAADGGADGGTGSDAAPEVATSD